MANLRGLETDRSDRNEVREHTLGNILLVFELELRRGGWQLGWCEANTSDHALLGFLISHCQQQASHDDRVLLHGKEFECSTPQGRLHVGLLPLRGKNRSTRKLLAVCREFRANVVAQDLLQMQKLATLGRSAAGVLHEISNALVVLRGNIDWVVSEVATVAESGRSVSAELRETLAFMREAVEHVSLLTQDAKGFARTGEDKVAAIDVVKAMQASLRFTEFELRARAKLQCEFAEVPLVLAAETPLRQVFINLLLNAVQSLDRSRSDNEVAVRIAKTAEGKVMVEVADTGRGIPAAVRDKLFLPFVSDKNVGLGLGLSICRQIVLGFGGEITADNRAQGGAVFRVCLPAARAAAVGGRRPLGRVASGREPGRQRKTK